MRYAAPGRYCTVRMLREPGGIVVRMLRAARAFADADAVEIEATARQLGESRRLLAPVTWAAGTVVLLLRGIRLLLLNWRLTLIELFPAALVWAVMWDLKQHSLRGAPFRDFTVGGGLLLALVAVAACTASFWCNTVFGFAIVPAEPRIRPAVQRTRPFLGRIVRAGLGVGLLLAVATVVVPRTGSGWLYVLSLGAACGVLLISLVTIPARILGVRKRKQPLKHKVGGLMASGTLSALVMTPGFVLDRLGVILLGIPGWNILGLVLLSIGSALYAAGMSSVKAVKLAMKLDTPS
jgi:hypothetical protein